MGLIAKASPVGHESLILSWQLGFVEHHAARP
jgi:hypothetical protein